ncbi:MAG: hypothetical protein V7756_13235 [Halopseudomonas sp.]|uniref:hypothetical protein n=1 Tax=Halopseudomonas sp. TaxID=2901191 RepID=UPI003001DBA0
MSPSPEEAAAALRAITSVQARAAGFQDYRAESRQLMLWGLVNLLGCVLTALFPQWLLLIWLAVVIVGLMAGVHLARMAQEILPGIVWRYLLVVGSVLVFAALLHAVMWPLTPRQGSMIVPLFVATLYVIRGAQSRPRYLCIGIALATLCFCCFLFATEHYWWWLGLGWGGTFIVSSFWLRRT